MTKYAFLAIFSGLDLTKAQDGVIILAKRATKYARISSFQEVGKEKLYGKQSVLG
jgi:hypothetical protein